MLTEEMRRDLPGVVHYASLAAGFLAILLLGSRQWFFGDDWAILAPRLDDDVMLPHVGHWNLIPALVFPLVRSLFGLDSYLPFLALAVFAHLAVAHLVWLILRRIGVGGWIATLLGVFFMMFGGAGENIMWAFQFGFMGAIALGLWVLVLFDRERLSPWISVAIVALSLVAPMFSGTAIPVLAAAAVVGWVRHGFGRAALLLVPTAVSYLAWYFLVARQYSVPVAGIDELGDVGSAVLYAAAMFGGGLGRALPVTVLGAIPALAVAIWFFATVRRRLSSAATAAYAMVIGSVVFVILTTYARMSFGITSAAAPRYAYLMVVMLLPAIGILLGMFAARGRQFAISTLVFIGLLAGFNAVVLGVDAAAQAEREQLSRGVVLDSLAAVLDNPDDQARLDSPADPTWAPDLLGSDLVELHDSGQLAAP
jgi:hypothetical protein